LFCSGIPGAGKTFLFSLVVDYLEQLSSNRDDVAIIYIYCDYKAQEKQKTEFLLASMVKQLLLQIQGRVPESIEKLYAKCTSGKLRPTTHELVRHCTQLISLFRETFLLIDGLDEQDVVHYLFQIYQSAPTLQIFTTSRPIPEIRDEFILRGSAEVEIQATAHDISLYLNAKMHRLPGWVLKAPGLFDDTVDSITRASQGM
jgi:Cdc6-like AAA superfamily ATPase